MDKHDTLLLACGTMEERRMLRQLLRGKYHLLEAGNARQMMSLLRQDQSCIAAVLLLITREDLVEQTYLMGEKEDLLQFPVIILAQEEDSDILTRCFQGGALDVIALEYEPYALLHRIENIVELSRHQRYLEEMVRQKVEALRHSSEVMIDVMTSMIEQRSGELGQHTLRIRHLTRILLTEVARACPEYGLEQRDIEAIASASVFHDIGKIAIPDTVLKKPGPLTEQERKIIQSHCLAGCRILDNLRDVAEADYLNFAYDICQYHHERWDGHGYPEGLSGNDIPIWAQVVGLVDAYDALRTPRVYKEAYSHPQSVNMLLKGACGAFSPLLMECFKRVHEEMEAASLACEKELLEQQQEIRMAPHRQNPQQENALERMNAKYNALVHYINGLLLEVDVEKKLFHLVYNPYPELNWLNTMTTFEEMYQELEQRVFYFDDHRTMRDYLQEELQFFLTRGLRRSTRYVHLQSQRWPEGEEFELNFIRINPFDAKKKSLAILCRRVQNAADRRTATAPAPLTDSTLVCRNDAGLTLVRLTDRMERLLGYSEQELWDHFHGQLLKLVLPEDQEKLRRTCYQQLTRGNRIQTEFRCRSKAGATEWVLMRAVVGQDENNDETLQCFLLNTTESRQHYEALYQKMQNYEIILSQTENVLFNWLWDTDTIHFSETWEKYFGFLPKKQHFREVLNSGTHFHPEDHVQVLDALTRLENGAELEVVDVRIVTSQGRYFWSRIRATAIRDHNGNIQKISGIMINVNAEKQSQRLLEEMAERDALTKLLNKSACRKQAEEYLMRYSQNTQCALLMIDLDNFKAVNDRFGHLFGDSVLTAVAREIEKLFRAQDILGRVGGDEFLVMMRGVADRQLVIQRCQMLLRAMTNLLHNAKMELPVSCSIGIALSPDHGTSYAELFRKADQALYQAKALGKNGYRVYNQEDGYPKEGGIKPATPIDSNQGPSMAESSLVRHAFQQLYSAEDVEKTIHDILALVGEKMNVSRVYVFENEEDGLYCSNTFEWCNHGFLPQKEFLQHLNYEIQLPGYRERFDEDGIFYCPDITQLPEETYRIAKEQDICSMLQCAIQDSSGIFRGFVGFDECVEQRLWVQDQVDVLRDFSQMLGRYLLHWRSQQADRRQAEQMQCLLNNQPGWLYVVEPETGNLRYQNQPAQQRFPGGELGKPCYQTLHRREVPCPGCPAFSLGQQSQKSLLMEDGDTGSILAEATAVIWEEKPAWMMTCRKLTVAK